MANGVVAVLALAFCLWWIPVGWSSGPSSTEHLYQLVVVDEPARLPSGARGMQAWLKDVIVDGRRAAASDLQLQGDWRTTPGPGQWHLRCEQPATRTTATVRAHTISWTALHHPWSGGLDVLRDGQRIDTVALTADEVCEVAQEHGFEPRVLRVLASLAGLTLLLTLARPWRGGVWMSAWLLIVVVFVHGACWVSQDVGVSNDTPGYPAAARQLGDGAPAYFPPGYGFLMLAMAAIGQPVGSATTLVQHAMMALLAVLLHRRFRQWLGDAGAFVGAFLGTALFPTLFGAQTLMSETLTCVLLAAPLLLAYGPTGRAGGWRAIAAGVTTALAGLTRVVPLAALLPLFVLRGLVPWRQRDWRWIAATAGTAVLLVGATLAYYGARSGQWQLSTGVGRHLYNHFVYEQKLLAPDAPATVQLRAYCGERDPRDLPHWDAYDAVQRSGRHAPDDAERLIHRVAMEAAGTAGPLEHVAFTCGLTWRNLSLPAAPTLTLGDTTMGGHPEFAQKAPLATRFAATIDARGRAWTAVLWPPLCWLFAASILAPLLLRERRGEWLAWVWLVWAYMFASSAVEFELPRYQVAVAPMVAMLGVGTVAVVVRRLRGNGGPA